MTIRDDIAKAVESALEGMRACGCTSCPSFESCAGRLVAAAGGASLWGAPRPGDKVRRGSRVGKLHALARLLVRKFRVAFAVAALLVGANGSAQEVVCDLHEDGNGGYTYCCSGRGTAAEDGTIVGNAIGVCTNCVAMTPQYVHDWKSQMKGEIDWISSKFGDIATESRAVANQLYSFVQYASSAPVASPVPASGNERRLLTNNIMSVCVPYGGDFLAAANSVFPVEYSITFYQASTCNAWGGAWNGARAYALAQVPTINAMNEQLQQTALDCDNMQQGTLMLYNFVDELSEDACTSAYNAAIVGGGGGGGGNSSTNSGNWCTFEQAEAIKDLLQDLKKYEEKKSASLGIISNEIIRVRNTIRHALYSDYTAIPRNTDWQDVYLDGNATGWGYEPSNVLQRIELLVYGISGISTNDNGAAWGEDTTPDPDSADFDDAQASLATFATDASASDLTTFAGALGGFFDVFSGIDGDQLHRGDIFVDEIPIRINDDQYLVPGVVAPDSQDLVSTFNSVQGIVRTGSTVVYLLGGSMLIFFFWRWFAAHAVKFTRWASEILNNLFSG